MYQDWSPSELKSMNDGFARAMVDAHPEFCKLVSKYEHQVKEANARIGAMSDRLRLLQEENADMKGKLDTVLSAFPELTADPPPPATMRSLLNETARRHGMTVAELTSRKRTHVLAHARHEFMWLARNVLHKSYPVIGTFLGMDHTTVLHGVRRHQRMLDDEAARRERAA